MHPDFQPSHSGWDGHDRRTTARGGGPPDDYVTRAELEARLASGRELMMKHFDERFDTLEKMIKDGFPGGDPRGHREVHERSIKRAEEKAALWKGIWEKAVGGSVIAALVFIGQAAWSQLITIIKATPK